MEQTLQIFDKNTLESYNKAIDEYIINKGFEAKTNEHRGNVCCIYKPMVLKPLVKKFASTVSKLVGKGQYDLTYWFMTDYYKNSYMEKHNDRPSCELSFTINMKQDGPNWPFYVLDQEFNCEPGEGVMYNGFNSHYRNKCPGNFYRQLMIHFVERNGKYSSHREVINDMRSLGDTQLF